MATILKPLTCFHNGRNLRHRKIEYSHQNLCHEEDCLNDPSIKDCTINTFFFLLPNLVILIQGFCLANMRFFGN